MPGFGRLFTTTALIALWAMPAMAAPWQYQTEAMKSGATGYQAYQMADDGDLVIAFECDDIMALGAISIQTGEPYEATTSYAPEVPTTFETAASRFEVNGMFVERQGYLYVLFDEVMDWDGMSRIFYELSDATAPMTVSFFGRTATFDMAGSAEALDQAATECGWYL